MTAAYALDALDEAEEREYEEHLRGCESCREELAVFTDTAAALAYAVDAPAPPAELRDRILDAARAERAVVIPFRPRRPVSYALGGLAAAAAAGALALGLWSTSLSDRLNELEDERAVLADPDARTTALAGADGRLVVGADGEAVLVVSGLARAPSGKDYEVWVIQGTRPPRPAGVFESDDRSDVVRLRERVPRGAVVAVTLERNGGVAAPTGDPLFTARA